VNYEFLAEARDEFREAALYYESKEAGLGVRLRDEVSHVIERILADPYLWREHAGGYRRVNCPVFPYYVAYQIQMPVTALIGISQAPYTTHSSISSPSPLQDIGTITPPGMIKSAGKDALQVNCALLLPIADLARGIRC
jgi:hypothetical protein